MIQRKAVKTVTNVWREQRSHVDFLKRTVEERKATLRSRRARLEQAFLYEGSINRETYDRQLELLTEEIATTDMYLPDVEQSHATVQSALDSIASFVTGVSTLWLDADPNQKLQLQSAVVPTGIDWDGETFGNRHNRPYLQRVSWDWS
jgi:hypothetical protein